jgi:hypothetical protein
MTMTMTGIMPLKIHADKMVYVSCQSRSIDHDITSAGGLNAVSGHAVSHVSRLKVNGLLETLETYRPVLQLQHSTIL